MPDRDRSPGFDPSADQRYRQFARSVIGSDLEAVTCLVAKPAADERSFARRGTAKQLPLSAHVLVDVVADDAHVVCRSAPPKCDRGLSQPGHFHHAERLRRGCRELAGSPAGPDTGTGISGGRDRPGRSAAARATSATVNRQAPRHRQPAGHRRPTIRRHRHHHRLRRQSHRHRHRHHRRLSCRHRYRHRRHPRCRAAPAA